MPLPSCETRETRRRRARALTVAVGIGVAYGTLLVHGLDVVYTATKVPHPPVRIALVSAPASVTASDPSGPPLLPRLPIEAHPITPHEELPVPAQPPPPEGAARGLLAELTAPMLTELEESTVQEEDPYLELRGRTYPEQPGGPVLVLAVLLDRHGHVHNAQIMVPSGNPLGDLTRLLSLPGTTLSDVPSIPAGQKRWIELRFRYESQTVALP